MRLLVTLILTVIGIGIPPAIAMSPAEQWIPEFVITKPSNEYCEFIIHLSPSTAGVAENRLFDFMEAASVYTKGWRTTFAVVGVNHVTDTTFSVISFSDCKASSTALDFITQFFDHWQKLHCVGKCHLSPPRVTSHSKLDFAIPYEKYAFKSQIGEFLHYRQRDALTQCAIEIELEPAMATDFAHTTLFGALMGLQREFRYPILDISQIDRKLYILLSRQCLDKETLYAKMLWNIQRQGVNVDAFHSVNFRPDVSDYLFSQTGQR